MNDHFKTKADADAGSVKLAELKNVRVGIIGLGYVGLPLAVYMARHFPVVGFDVNKARVGELAKHRDRTGEVTDDEFAAARTLSFTADLEALRACNFYVVTVPTPIDEAKRPDLTALMRASETVGRVLSPGDVVVYEFDGLSRRHGRGLRADPGKRILASPSTAISSSATRRSASILAIGSTGCRASSRSPPAPRPKPPTSSTRSMAAW